MSQYFLDEKDDENKSEYNNSTASIVFSAFALEAFLNHVGEQLINCWQDNIKKSLNVEGKLALICENINVEVNYGIEHFQSFRTTFRFGNVMAHSNTESLSIQNSKHFLEVGNMFWPAAEWEKLTNYKVAETIHNNARKIIDLINEYSKIESIPEFLLSEFIET